jgi:hypothetical protein
LPGGLLRVALNEVAAYAFRAHLEPGNTLEFPADYDDNVGGRCFLIDVYAPENFERSFGLMVVIEIHRDEMHFAMEVGGDALIAKLKALKVYPYSDMHRPSVLNTRLN